MAEALINPNKTQISNRVRPTKEDEMSLDTTRPKVGKKPLIPLSISAALYNDTGHSTCPSQ